MATDAIGLYVHVPFCRRKCNYCDFCSAAPAENDFDAYLSALLDEIDGYRYEEKIKVSTVFFGGGTPSVLPPACFRKIGQKIREVFDVLPDAEISAEANPGTLTKDVLNAFLEFGVNRISIGAQSFCENELKKLGRIHTSDQIQEAVRLILSAGIGNFSIDLMYGIPNQTTESFSKTLDAAIALSPSHISCYGLMIEEGTPFYQMKDTLPLPSEDDECDMYTLAHKKLTANGYIHYEISNYAKSGFECRHNLKYWHRDEYIGLGPAAHSFYRGKRFYNSSDVSEYFLKKVESYRCEDNSVMSEPEFEYAMLRLRLVEGIDLSDYEKKFGKSFISGRDALISSLEKEGLVTLTQNRFALTTQGFYLSNAIMAELL